MSSLPTSTEILDFCLDLMYDQPESRLIDYLGWSDNSNFEFNLCRSLMLERTPFSKIPHLNFKVTELNLFKKRFDLINSNNQFYDCIITKNPSIEIIEATAKLDQSYATLMPIKRYIIDHPSLAKSYKSFLPFGKEVKKFYNTIVDSSRQIKASPSSTDYIHLKNITNDMSDLSSIPTITINTWMYKKGLNIPDSQNS